MFPIIHFLSSLIIFVLLYPIYGLQSIAVFLGGFFIDVDHYIWYALEKRKLNLLTCYKELTREAVENRKKFKIIKKRPIYLNRDRLHIFHVWEFWALMIFLSFFYQFFFIISLGMFMHLSLDFIDLFRNRVYGSRANSYLCWLYRHTIKK